MSQKTDNNQKPIKVETNGDIKSAFGSSKGELITKMNGIRIGPFPGTTTRMMVNSSKKEIPNIFSNPLDAITSAQTQIQSIDQSKDKNCTIF